jgi:NADPH:quinone reductase-like Zn-dependent oxidoreductase
MMRAGYIPLDGLPSPYVPGMEAAGVVDEIGPDTVTELAVGDRAFSIVMPVRPAGGAYAEYVTVPAAWISAAPAGSSHAEAATLPMNGLTAMQIIDRLELRPSRAIAVIGAVGGLGGYVVQLAKNAGLRVVADAAPKDEDLVRSLGADVVVPRGEQIAERIRVAAAGGVDALVDTALLGIARLAPAIGDGGRYATVRNDDEVGTQPWVDPGRGITRVNTWVPDYLGDHDRLDQLRKLAESGVLTLRVGRTFPADQAADAHRALEAGGIRGRVVIELSNGSSHLQTN